MNRIARMAVALFTCSVLVLLAEAQGTSVIPLPLQPAASGWTEYVPPNTGGLCNPLNPFVTGFSDVTTSSGPGVQLSTASNTCGCCTCIAKNKAFTLPVLDAASTVLQGWFSATRGATDTFCLAGFRVRLFSLGLQVGTRNYVAESRPNNNCGLFDQSLLVSGAPFTILLSTIAGGQIDAIEIEPQGYGCCAATNSVVLGGTQLVTDADGIVGAAGGTVVDSAGTGAVFRVGPTVLAGDVSVSIEVISAPGISPPPGFIGPATFFVSFILVPNPSPLPAPGATITLPLAFSLPPGTPLFLFEFTLPSTLTSTGIVGTVDVSGTTATFSGVTDFSVYVAYQEATVPFATFEAKVEIEGDEFEVKATFTLGAGSGGIDPLTEEVSFQVGTFSTSIPAGAFKQDKKGRFKVEGVIDGVALEVVIQPLRGGSFEFKAEGEGADLTGTANPVAVALTIGDDSGSTTTTAEFGD